MTFDAHFFHIKQAIIEKLKTDPHYYDEYVSKFVQCGKCNGTGELYQEVGEWESEGGMCSFAKRCSCDGEKVRITEDIVRRFFDLPMPSRYLVLKVRRSGACGFDIVIKTCLNPSLQNEAMNQFDSLFKDAKECTIRPWSIAYEEGVSYRYLSGDVKEVQSIIQKWIKNLTQKVGKEYISTENFLQV